KLRAELGCSASIDGLRAVVEGALLRLTSQKPRVRAIADRGSTTAANWRPCEGRNGLSSDEHGTARGASRRARVADGGHLLVCVRPHCSVARLRHARLPIGFTGEALNEPGVHVERPSPRPRGKLARDGSKCAPAQQCEVLRPRLASFSFRAVGIQEQSERRY